MLLHIVVGFFTALDSLLLTLAPSVKISFNARLNIRFEQLWRA